VKRAYLPLVGCRTRRKSAGGSKAVVHPNRGDYDLVLRNCGHVSDVEVLALDEQEGLVLSTARPT